MAHLLLFTFLEKILCSKKGLVVFLFFTKINAVKAIAIVAAAIMVIRVISVIWFMLVGRVKSKYRVYIFRSISCSQKCFSV